MLQHTAARQRVGEKRFGSGGDGVPHGQCRLLRQEGQKRLEGYNGPERMLKRFTTGSPRGSSVWDLRGCTGIDGCRIDRRTPTQLDGRPRHCHPAGRQSLASEDRSSTFLMDASAFGLFAVSAMLVCYVLEDRSLWWTLAFGCSCVLGSIYGFLQGAWPFGAVEGVWSIVAFRRWWMRKAAVSKP